MKHPPFLSLRLAIVFQFLVNFRSDVVAFHLPGGNLYRVGGRTYTCPVTAPQLPSLDTLYFARSVPRTINIVTSTSTDSKNNAFGTAPPAPTSLPYPRLGDVVLFPGKWVGDTGIGQIRFLQLTGDGRGGKEWIADLTPFKDVGEDLYRAEKGARARTFPVSALQPLSHFYIGSSDAFKVPHKEEAGGEGMGRRREPVRMAPGYRTEGFSLAPAKVDAEAMEAARSKYRDLKRRILTDTAAFGGLATVAVGLNAGVEDAGIFLAGVAGSVLYLVLLTQRADAMGQAGGEGGGLSKARGGSLVGRSVGATRFLVPVVLIAALAYKNLYMEGGGGGAGLAGGRLFNYVPQDEFWSATLGFLSYRVPMLGREEGEVDGRDYHFVEDFAFQVMREQGRFLTAYQEEAGEGRAWFGLRPSDVVDVMRKEGKVSVLALDAFAADKLLALGEARLIGVWVTLNTVDQLRERYGGEEGGKEEEVEAAVSRATVAIEHALMGGGGEEGLLRAHHLRRQGQGGDAPVAARLCGLRPQPVRALPPLPSRRLLPVPASPRRRLSRYWDGRWLGGGELGPGRRRSPENRARNKKRERALRALFELANFSFFHSR
ncbi:conserved unknown protein [Nannochloropsis gaditana]|uniref:CGL160/ATPI domain-containing protein n=1 Tax=Nannochloropsis gaditana TaxID=72520 RepID=W7TQL2_9STRA|nr:conserved unknown protein [Nannochloropsis gaditana]